MDQVSFAFAGPFDLLSSTERYVLLFVDYTSKWVVTKCVSVVSTRVVIDFLREEFTREGTPRTIVTDNGVQFVSQDMREFLDGLSTQHQKMALYTPQANGLVE